MKEENHGPKVLMCTGVAAEALARYRMRVREWSGAFNPGMKAYSELRNSVGTPTGYRKVHGEIDGVPIGLELESRGEAAILGIHCQLLKGIDSLKDNPCFAVCLSGGYGDDDFNRGNGTITYTGSGGQAKGKMQTNQSDNCDNLSLKLAANANAPPIRVLRKLKHGCYRYEGLYQCTGWRYEKGTEGAHVYKFTLEPIAGKHVQYSLIAPHIMKAIANRHNNNVGVRKELKKGGLSSNPKDVVKTSGISRKLTTRDGQMGLSQVQEWGKRQCHGNQNNNNAPRTYALLPCNLNTTKTVPLVKNKKVKKAPPKKMPSIMAYMKRA